jgi:hypothetical protein
MMKPTRFFLVLGLLSIVIFVTSCGKKHGKKIGPFPTVEQLLLDGWAAYLVGNYDLAIAKFDSAVTIKADESEGYLGLGWSQTQSGLFTESLSSFSLAISLEGIRPVVEVFDEDSDVSAGTLWVIEPQNRPFLGMPDLTIKSITDPLDTLSSDEVFYDVVGFTDSTITLTWSPQNDSPTGRPPDSAGVYDDSLLVSYSYLNTSVAETEIQVDAYAGMATLASANNEELLAILSGNGVLQMDNGYFFSKDSTGANARMTHILLAQSFYNLKLFESTSGEILIVDPSWATDPRNDPNSPTYLYDLQQKIEELRG